MRGSGASGAKAMLEAAWAEMVTALLRGMERFHLSGAAIKAANQADDGARQGRRGINTLELIVQPASGVINACEQSLYPRDCTGDRRLEHRQATVE